MDNERKKCGNYLSIDGGQSGLPALHVLEEAFSRLQDDLKSKEELVPCRWFNIIIGTGPGALVALLIGRLQMTASKALEVYMKLLPVLPVKVAKNDVERSMNTEEFQKAFLDVLLDVGFTADTPMMDQEGPKTIVCTANASSISVLHLIRSYRVRGTPAPQCTILQAACACIASPDKFLPVTVGDGHRKVVLVDAMAGYANPTRELLREAQDVFGDGAEATTIISIGAGKRIIQAAPSNGQGSELNEALKQGMLHCEQVHEDLQARLMRTAIYFRFNVERELLDEPEVILAHTSGYLRESMPKKRLDEAIHRIEVHPPGMKLKDINSVTVIEIALKPRPSLVQNFVGRKDILNALHHTHITNRSLGLTTPAITVLSGLGGSGKTQTALKFALDLETLNPDVSVYFLNASTEESLKADYETLIRSLGSEYHSKSYGDALSLLADKMKDWILILDNADNPRLHLFAYLPKCTHGNVVITTRNSNHAILAPSSSHHLEGLPTTDAIQLILTASGSEDTDVNRSIAGQIVEELGHLPLALAQAAGYIFVHKTLSTFLDLYRSNTGKLLATVPLHLPSDYPSSVATTIQMSLERLPVEAQNALRLFSHLDSTSIASEIISNSAQRRFRRVVQTQNSDLTPQTIQHADTLMKIFCSGGSWSEIEFNELINQCLQYSLLRLTTQGNFKFYSMHILVQAYLRAILDPVQGNHPGRLTVRLLGSSITSSKDYKYWAFNRILIPHIQLIKIEDIVEGGDHFGFGYVLQSTGHGKLAVPYMERCVELWTASLGSESANTLAAMRNLAVSYKAMGNYQKALEMEEQLLEITKKLEGPEHTTALLTMGNLASSYHLVGRYQEALDLDEKVLEARKKILGEEHPDTLRTMFRMSVTYAELGRHQEAFDLDQVVLEMQTRLLGADHPDTLHTMRNHLYNFEHFGMIERLVNSLQLALPLHEQVLGADHPSTIKLKKNFEHYLDKIQMEGAQSAVSLPTSGQMPRSTNQKRNNSTPNQAPPAKKRKTSTKRKK